jgi:hypothetical protein
MNTSGLPRRTLYYCYSTGFMPDWGGDIAPGCEVIDAPPCTIINSPQ